MNTLSMRCNAALLLLVATVACSGVNRKDYGRLADELKAENVVMTKKVLMLQRENSVVNRENIRYKRDLDQKTAEIEKREAEKKSLINKYTGEINLLQGKYHTLEHEIKILQTTSGEKINELVRLNQKTELTLGAEIKKLGQQLHDREQMFGREREQLRKDFAQKESSLLQQMEDAKKKMASLENELSKSVLAINELKAKLLGLSSEIDRKNREIEALKKSATPGGSASPVKKDK